MPAVLHDHLPGRLSRILLVLIAVFGLAVVALPPPDLILLLNGLALSVSAGVSTAYLPVAAGALGARTPSRGDVLGAGIFFAGLSDVALRVQSLIARNFGYPAILNSDVAAVSIFLGVMALVAFVWAPHAEDGRVPREKWLAAGLMVAAGVAIALGAGLMHHVLAPAPAIRLE